MMESSNLNIDLHHHQEEFHGSSSPSFHFMGKEPHKWNHDNLLPSCGTSGDFTPNSNGFHTAASARELMRGSHEMAMGQDLGFLHWAPSLNGGGEGYLNMMIHHSPHHQAAIKEEPAKLLLQDYHHLMPPPPPHQIMQEATNYQIHNAFDLLRFPAGGSVAAADVGNFNSAVLPTANIPSSSLSTDLLDSARFCRTMAQPPVNCMRFLREDAAAAAAAYSTIIGQLQQQHPTAQPTAVSSSNHHKVSNSVSAVTEGKRSITVDSKTPQIQSTAKKPRFESRSSCSTPFKVRKEKLGDRIAALQQLVAPFGKTDTASVLMEAIGYIKFLQDQVETLSVPYMRSSNNKTLRASQGASSEEKVESKTDLRSRGLCLVPLSCTSYVTNENGGVWSPANYRGGT